MSFIFSNEEVKVIQENADRIRDMLMDEIDRRAHEMYEQLISSAEDENKKNCHDGYRRITVLFDPRAKVDNLDYVTVVAEPENDDEGMNDTVALLLAAAKRLSESCPAIDGEAYCTDLLSLTESHMKATILEQLIGGI